MAEYAGRLRGAKARKRDEERTQDSKYNRQLRRANYIGQKRERLGRQAARDDQKTKSDNALIERQRITKRSEGRQDAQDARVAQATQDKAWEDKAGLMPIEQIVNFGDVISGRTSGLNGYFAHEMGKDGNFYMQRTDKDEPTVMSRGQLKGIMKLYKMHRALENKTTQEQAKINDERAFKTKQASDKYENSRVVANRKAIQERTEANSLLEPDKQLPKIEPYKHGTDTSAKNKIKQDRARANDILNNPKSTPAEIKAAKKFFSANGEKFTKKAKKPIKDKSYPMSFERNRPGKRQKLKRSKKPVGASKSKAGSKQLMEAENKRVLLEKQKKSKSVSDLLAERLKPAVSGGKTIDPMLKKTRKLKKSRVGPIKEAVKNIKKTATDVIKNDKLIKSEYEKADLAYKVAVKKGMDKNSKEFKTISTRAARAEYAYNKSLRS